MATKLNEDYEEVVLDLTREQIKDLIDNLKSILDSDKEDFSENHFHMLLNKNLGLTISKIK